MNDDLMFSVGVVVKDTFGREGIVCSSEGAPPKDWIDDQVAAKELKKLGPDVRWWGVMPFGGGYLLCPEPELKYVRQASYDDFVSAADTAGSHGRERLLKIFPEYVDRLLKEKQRDSPDRT